MSETFTILLPEVVLAVLACLMFVGGTFKIPGRAWPWLALASLALAGATMLVRPGAFTVGNPPLYLSVVKDHLTIGFCIGSLVVAALFVLTSWSQSEGDSPAEFYGLLLLAVAGMMLVSAANDLVLMLLALELISVPTYVLLYLGRRDHASQEAAVKYFLLSVMSSAVLLYGFALLYGLTGTTNLQFAQTILVDVAGRASNPSVLGIVAMVLILAGLGFKVAAVPFHFYAPDVYQGTSAFNAGFLAVVPKAAGFVALLRVANETLIGFESTGERTALILAIITMTGGNTLALLQTNVRRILAYSSIAHAGYMLIGIAVAFWDHVNEGYSLNATGVMGMPGGARAMLLYLLTYCVSSAGMFAVLVYLARKGRQVDHIDELTGLGRTQPIIAVAAAVFLFSMMGIPPLAGFWGKFAIFSSALSVRVGPTALHQGFVALAIIGVLNAAVASVYYLKIVAVMFLNEPIGQPKPEGGRGAYAAVLASVVLVLGIGLMPSPFFQYLARIPVNRPEPTTPGIAHVDEAKAPVAMKAGGEGR